VAAAAAAGTGKTTLAHVVAAHCGFRVVEVNASDERTAASLTRRITDVAQMQSVLDGEEEGAQRCRAGAMQRPAAHSNAVVQDAGHSVCLCSCSCIGRGSLAHRLI
jgi:MoxR-like ATPase